MLCAKEAYTSEFRSYSDDAWYSVLLVADGEKLLVKYENFPDDEDSVFDAGNFKSLAELGDFRARFRRISRQVQDQDCHEISRGKHLCASHAFSCSDVRFYDAIAKEVQRQEHTFTQGKEECSCSFLLYWQHGPNAGMLAVKNIENICIVEAAAETEPYLASFMEMAVKKLNNRSDKSDSGSVFKSNEGNGIPVIKMTTFPLQLQEEESARGSSWEVCSFEDTAASSDREDVDVGGVQDHHAILIQNVEKDLSSSAIVEFIYKKTLIASQACVFPSLSWEPSAQGAIILNSKSDLDKLVDFLHDPNHLVISSRGRPWVVTQKMSTKDAGNLFLQPLVGKSGNHKGNELARVVAGTEEHKTAKAQRDLFMELMHHQKGRYKRLRAEEARSAEALR